MAQSLSQLWTHIIFSTKKRYPYLKDITTQKRVHDYILAICHNLNCHTMIVGGVEDHIHLLTSLHKTLSLSELVEEIKKSSSKWVKTLTTSTDLTQFYWQNGYSAFSVSQSNVETVKRYIQNQPHHHQRITFQDELKKFLIQYDVKYREEYLWD